MAGNKNPASPSHMWNAVLTWGPKDNAINNLQVTQQWLLRAIQTFQHFPSRALQGSQPSLDTPAGVELLQFCCCCHGLQGCAGDPRGCCPSYSLLDFTHRWWRNSGANREEWFSSISCCPGQTPVYNVEYWTWVRFFSYEISLEYWKSEATPLTLLAIHV